MNSSDSVICPWIDDGSRITEECGRDFERYCYYLWTHSSNDLDCHDRDGTSFRTGLHTNAMNGINTFNGHSTW